MIAPRHLIVEAAKGPTGTFSGDGGGAPARLLSPELTSVQSEVLRAGKLVEPLALPAFPQLIVSGDGQGSHGISTTLQALLDSLSAGSRLSASESSATFVTRPWGDDELLHRHREHMQQVDRHTQIVLRESPKVRAAFLQRLDTTSLEAYQRTSDEYRKFFREEVIGQFNYPLVDPHPRTRQVYETEHWRGYEVVLDVFEDIFAYGLLLVPKDVTAGERRPVVVCQHGLEGRPQDTVGVQGREYYSGFAGKLADQGFITFAPQNLYIGHDRFRTLQRKS
jgi:hypothetical protein